MLDPEEYIMWRTQEILERTYRYRLQGETPPQGRHIVIHLHEGIGSSNRPRWKGAET